MLFRSHPPCILTTSAGEARLLERTGPALGLERDAEYGEHKVLFDMEDRLLLYTDGVLAEGAHEKRGNTGVADSGHCYDMASSGGPHWAIRILRRPLTPLERGDGARRLGSLDAGFAD